METLQAGGVEEQRLSRVDGGGQGRGTSSGLGSAPRLAGSRAGGWGGCGRAGSVPVPGAALALSAEEQGGSSRQGPC